MLIGRSDLTTTSWLIVIHYIKIYDSCNGLVIYLKLVYIKLCLVWINIDEICVYSLVYTWEVAYNYVCIQNVQNTKL